VARNHYGTDKRQRELNKQRKREEKRQRKLERKDLPEGTDPEAAPEDEATSDPDPKL
jgi:hypothetical protein